MSKTKRETVKESEGAITAMIRSTSVFLGECWSCLGKNTAVNGGRIFYTHEEHPDGRRQSAFHRYVVLLASQFNLQCRRSSCCSINSICSLPPAEYRATYFPRRAQVRTTWLLARPIMSSHEGCFRNKYDEARLP